MRIARFDPLADEASLRACYQLTLAGQPIDDPNQPTDPFAAFRAFWAYGFADDPTECWLGTGDAGEPAGAYLLELPLRENRRNAFGSVLVAPAARRRGYGVALLAHLARQAQQAGRTRLLSGTRVGAPGEAFAAATGGTRGLVEVRRQLRVDASARDTARALLAEAEPYAAGYELRCWAGQTPEDLMGGMCATHAALGDAPHDAAFEPARWDADRLRIVEQRRAAAGIRWLSVAAIAVGSGQMAGLTQVDVHATDPVWAEQALTAVIREHRGHRLGLLIKAAMLDLLAEREPAVVTMVTYNADSNKHMVAINERLGYQVSDYFQFWEHDIAAACGLA